MVLRPCNEAALHLLLPVQSILVNDPLSGCLLLFSQRESRAGSQRHRSLSSEDGLR